MPLSAFEPKYVRGLYSFTHYQAPNGAWFQVHVRGAEEGLHYLGADKTGPIMSFPSFAAFRAWYEAFPHN
jgi:hypothetical protein